MDIGLTVWLDRPPRETADLAVAAEAAGFSDIWLPDHYFLRDAYVAQALMAERTSQIRLGTAVVSPQLRHPALLASSTATINELSGGRAVIGIGPGGFEFPRHLHLAPDKPVAMLRDAVAVVRALFAGEASYQGAAFSIDGGALGWTAGEIPVYVAARGPRMLELGGELADGLITHGLAGSYLDFATARIAAGAARAGRAASSCELCLMFDVELGDDEQAALDRLRPRCVVMAGGAYAEELIPVYGLRREDVLPLREAVRAGDLAAAARLVTDEMVEAFAVAGSNAKLADRLRQLHDKGVGRAILNVGAGASLEDALRRIERAGRAVQEAIP